MFWVRVSRCLFWGLCSCLGTKFLGLSSLFQWFGSPLKCKRIMQILANYERETTDCRAGQTGSAGGNINVDGCLCEPMYSWEVTILACQAWHWSFILYFLPDNPFVPASRLTHTVSSMLLLCCKCLCILSFFSNPFWEDFFNISTKLNIPKSETFLCLY